MNGGLSHSDLSLSTLTDQDEWHASAALTTAMSTAMSTATTSKDDDVAVLLVASLTVADDSQDEDDQQRDVQSCTENDVSHVAHGEASSLLPSFLAKSGRESASCAGTRSRFYDPVSLRRDFFLLRITFPFGEEKGDRV